MTFYTAISVFATVGFNQVLTATKTVGLRIFEKILLSFPFLPLLNSVYWVCMTRFCWWRSAGGFCVKLPLCPTELVLDGSKTVTAGRGQAPQGWWNSPWDLSSRRRKICTTTCGWRVRWEGKKQFCRHPENISVENEEQEVLQTPEIPLQSMEDPTARYLNVTLSVDAWNKAVGSWAQPPLPLPRAAGGEEGEKIVSELNLRKRTLVGNKAISPSQFCFAGEWSLPFLILTYQPFDIFSLCFPAEKENDRPASWAPGVSPPHQERY